MVIDHVRPHISYVDEKRTFSTCYTVMTRTQEVSRTRARTRYQVQHVPTSTSRTHLEFALLSMLTMLHNVDKAFSRRCFLKLQWVSKQIAPVGEKILINTVYIERKITVDKSMKKEKVFSSWLKFFPENVFI